MSTNRSGLDIAKKDPDRVPSSFNLNKSRGEGETQIILDKAPTIQQEKEKLRTKLHQKQADKYDELLDMDLKERNKLQRDLIIKNMNAMQHREYELTKARERRAKRMEDERIKYANIIQKR